MWFFNAAYMSMGNCVPEMEDYIKGARQDGS